MNVHLVNAKAEFWRTYATVRQSLMQLNARELEDLAHTAEDQMRPMSAAFSERAAAQLVHAACVELLAMPPVQAKPN